MKPKQARNFGTAFGLCLLLLPLTASGFYNPTVGKWLSRDPIQEKGGLNLLGFCRNSPVSCFDPLGLDVWVIRESSGLIQHHWAVGNNADGTYWISDFNPTASGVEVLNCKGKISFDMNNTTLIPTNLASGFVIAGYQAASQSATDATRDYAKKRSESVDQPRYAACFNNCIDWAQGLAVYALARRIEERLDKILNEKK
jgi:uncharacterized protein RhaS with RHS repeats